MEMKFDTHTIIMLVGPTESGKTTFAKEVLMPQLGFEDESKNFKMNVQYLSSDDIRREILGNDLSKHSSMMMESSKLAFSLFNHKLDVVTSYPVNAEFVILDTTGLAEEFRKEISSYAKKNHYKLDVVVFDYNNSKDYYITDLSKKVVDNQVRRLKRNVLKDLTGKHYNNVYRVRHKDFLNEDGIGNSEKYSVTINNLESYVNKFLNKDEEYLIVGDVHEHLEGLIDLLVKNKFIIEDGKIVGNKFGDNKRILLVGDWIDKGSGVKDITNFLYSNKEWFKIVMGNHENFVMKYLDGDIKSADKEVVNKYFTSIDFLAKEENKETLDKAKVLFDLAEPFYISRQDNKKSFIVTHAPCEKRYLGKIDNISVRKQRVFRVDREKDIEEQLSFLKEEAEFNEPYHVFGHVPNKKGIRLQNKVGIDTGAINGNELTGVIIVDRVFYSSVKTKHIEGNEKELPILFKQEEKNNVKWNDLTSKEKYSVYRKAEQKINFISGTMTPSDKDIENNELESLSKGLEYFKDNGVEKLIIQPKYMGSRANLYLNRDINKSYTVSRNGFRINHVDMSNIYKKELEKHGKFMEENKLNWMVLDGELLPWKVLGEGLIEDSFLPVARAVEKESDLLSKFGFDKQVKALMKEKDNSNFNIDKNKFNKKDLYNMYGGRLYQNYKNLEGYNHIDVEDHMRMIEVFKEQVEWFGSDGEPYYKPFSILKMIGESGENIFFDGDTEEMFKLISDDEYVVIDLNDENYLEVAQEFFDKLTVSLNMEGVVLKPVKEVEGVLPFMKVRNERYLTLVYGYDYKLPFKYNKLMKSKNIRGKSRASLKEHEVGKKLLEIKYDDINRDNTEYKKLVADMMFEVKKEEGIDPRL